MQTIEERLEKYISMYEQLHDKLKWKAADKRTWMVVASLYAVSGKPFHFPQFLELSEALKRNTGFFSPLRSYSRFTLAAMLDIRFERPEEAVQELFTAYRTLVAGGYNRGIFTYIAAASMLSNRINYEEIALRSQEMYKAMRANHLFLTASSDYPLAVLLAKTEGTIEEITARVETYYSKLHKGGFAKGNDLQFLSHILSLQRNVHIDSVVEHCITLLRAFVEAKQKIKRMHYGAIGLLALLTEDLRAVQQVIAMTEKFNETKSLKSYKDMNMLIAVHLLVSDKISDPRMLETGLYTAIEAIVQAQQATMIASMAAVAAASSSSGDSSS